jgi:hypothetical protein
VCLQSEASYAFCWFQTMKMPHVAYPMRRERAFGQLCWIAKPDRNICALCCFHAPELAIIPGQRLLRQGEDLSEHACTQ